MKFVCMKARTNLIIFYILLFYIIFYISYPHLNIQYHSIISQLNVPFNGQVIVVVNIYCKKTYFFFQDDY